MIIPTRASVFDSYKTYTRITQLNICCVLQYTQSLILSNTTHTTYSRASRSNCLPDNDFKSVTIQKENK